MTCSLFSGRKQSVKIGNYVSQPLHIHGVVSQSAIFGMDKFVIMIDDLKSPYPHPLYKYVDDTTPLEIINGRPKSTIQKMINAVT